MKKKENMKVYTGTNHQGGSASSPYGITRLSPAIVLADTEEQLSVAGAAIVQTSNAKLDMIIKQIEFLKQQAEKVILDARHDVMLHQATCAFDKKIGQTYHLYKKKNGSMQWSILSLEDWNGCPPWEYISSYKLMSDQTWQDTNDSETKESIDFSDLILANNTVQKK